MEPITLSLFALVSLTGLFAGWRSHLLNKKMFIIGVIGVILFAINTVIAGIGIYDNHKAMTEKKFDVVNYYNDGTLHFTGDGSFIHKNAVWKWYSKDGVLIKLAEYDDNILDGQYKLYYNNGNIKISGEYDNGEKILNTWICYNKNGTEKQCYVNNPILKKKNTSETFLDLLINSFKNIFAWINYFLTLIINIY